MRRAVDRAGKAVEGTRDQLTKTAMMTKDQWRERENQWAGFHRWEAEQPLPDRSAGDIIADLGAIWDWLPPEVRLEDPDPEKRGIQILLRAFKVLDKKL